MRPLRAAIAPGGARVPASSFIARPDILARLLRLRDKDRLAQPLLLVGPDYSPDYSSACHDMHSCSTSTAP